CAFASHGDTKHICLYPADPREAFEFAVAAFDLAERFQTPVFVLTDLDIGMNDWMVPKLTWDDDYYPNRGKVLSAEELESIAAFYRYTDVDGDGIPYRTLPGVHPKGAYFTRGSGHNAKGGYTEDADEYQEVMDRIARKIDEARYAVPVSYVRRAPGAKDGILSIGGCHAACMEATDLLAPAGHPIDYLRVRGFPFGKEVGEFIESHENVYVVEQNRDAQLRSLLILDLGACGLKLKPVLNYSGFPMNAQTVVNGVLRAEDRSA
ncbi:MAG TPA: hypothetical protein VMI31_00065, partial [Fimbriimonadaceae bacterium]|nr:hypothetical protein [Fimbriimonadaceae bacterium]